MSLPTSSDNLGSRAFKTSSNSHCGSLSPGFGLEPNSFRRSAIRSQIRFDAAVIGRPSLDLSDYRPKSSKQPNLDESGRCRERTLMRKTPYFIGVLALYF